MRHFVYCFSHCSCCYVISSLFYLEYWSSRIRTWVCMLWSYVFHCGTSIWLPWFKSWIWKTMQHTNLLHCSSYIRTLWSQPQPTAPAPTDWIISNYRLKGGAKPRGNKIFFKPLKTAGWLFWFQCFETSGEMQPLILEYSLIKKLCYCSGMACWSFWKVG